MKLINNFATKSSLTGRWVGISAENWRISGEIVTKNIKCCRQTGNRGGHFVFWDIEPEMLGHNSAEVPGHRPIILLTCKRKMYQCNEVSLEERKSNFKHYWQYLSNTARIAFVHSHMEVHHNKADQERIKKGLPAISKQVRAYHLNGKRVCKGVFLRTL